MVLLVLLASITVGAFHSRHTSVAAPVTAPATRGDIVSMVVATGTLNAVTTVEVGSEVTGTIESLGADFNQIVHKGQILARLDPLISRRRSTRPQRRWRAHKRMPIGIAWLRTPRKPH